MADTGGRASSLALEDSPYRMTKTEKAMLDPNYKKPKRKVREIRDQRREEMMNNALEHCREEDMCTCSILIPIFSSRALMSRLSSGTVQKRARSRRRRGTWPGCTT